MKADKNQSMDFLRLQGKNDEATRAGAQMPDQVNTDTDQGLLGCLGGGAGRPQG